MGGASTRGAGPSATSGSTDASSAAGGAPRLLTVPPPDVPHEVQPGRAGALSSLNGAGAGGALLPRVMAVAGDLPPSCHCLFRVRGVNAVGEGPWSAPPACGGGGGGGGCGADV